MKQLLVEIAIQSDIGRKNIYFACVYAKISIKKCSWNKKMKLSEIFTRESYQKIKHSYCIYPYQNAMPTMSLNLLSGEELIYKYSEISQLARTNSFAVITAIKVLIVVFAPLLLLNYLGSFLPAMFAEESGWGYMDLLVAVFIVWDSVKTYQAIKNYYPNLINTEIRNRVISIRSGLQAQ